MFTDSVRFHCLCCVTRFVQVRKNRERRTRGCDRMPQVCRIGEEGENPVGYKAVSRGVGRAIGGGRYRKPGYGFEAVLKTINSGQVWKGTVRVSNSYDDNVGNFCGPVDCILPADVLKFKHLLPCAAPSRRKLVPARPDYANDRLNPGGRSFTPETRSPTGYRAVIIRFLGPVVYITIRHRVRRT